MKRVARQTGGKRRKISLTWDISIVCNYLDLRDLVNLAKVCKDWKAWVKHSLLDIIARAIPSVENEPYGDNPEPWIKILDIYYLYQADLLSRDQYKEISSKFSVQALNHSGLGYFGPHSDQRPCYLAIPCYALLGTKEEQGFALESNVLTLLDNMREVNMPDHDALKALKVMKENCFPSGLLVGLVMQQRPVEFLKACAALGNEQHYRLCFSSEYCCRPTSQACISAFADFDWDTEYLDQVLAWKPDMLDIMLTFECVRKHLLAGHLPVLKHYYDLMPKWLLYTFNGPIETLDQLLDVVDFCMKDGELRYGNLSRMSLTCWKWLLEKIEPSDLEIKCWLVDLLEAVQIGRFARNAANVLVLWIQRMGLTKLIASAVNGKIKVTDWGLLCLLSFARTWTWNEFFGFVPNWTCLPLKIQRQAVGWFYEHCPVPDPIMLSAKPLKYTRNINEIAYRSIYEKIKQPSFYFFFSHALSRLTNMDTSRLISIVAVEVFQKPF